MSRLPRPGGDDDTWGDVLNDFLKVEHNPDGSQKTLPVSKGGTGATDAGSARASLGAADDSAVVHQAGTETIAGDKNFTGALTKNGTDLITKIADAADVTLSSPGQGDTLAYDPASGKWKNGNGGSHAPVFRPYAHNPVVDLVSTASHLTTFADVIYDADEKLFHMFAHVDGSPYGIYEMTSKDGLSFDAASAVKVLGLGTETWENTTVGVPTVWKDGSTWNLLYAGTGTGSSARQVGLATRNAVSGSFTRAQTTPVLSSSGTGWETASGVETGPGRVIKVGETYHLFYSTLSGASTRSVGHATSTDLLTWTKDAANPIFGGGRFCGSVWTDGDLYYSLMPHYRSIDLAVDLELWQSSGPEFYPNDRTLVGIVYRSQVGQTTGTWDAKSYDTPVVVCDDITRSSQNCTGGSPRIYYGGEDTSNNWLTGVLERVDGSRVTPSIDHRQVSMLDPWAKAAIAASLSSSTVFLMAGGSNFSHLVMPFGGSIVSIAAAASVARTAGTLTATATAALAKTALAVTFDGTNTGTNSASVSPGVIPFAHGQAIGVVLDTTSDFLPITMNAHFVLGVVFDQI